MMTMMNNDSDAAQVRIAVLGDLEVLRDGEAARLAPSKKTRALMAYLACVDRPQRRERLCEMFWEIPDDPRGALRWSLSKIRQVVGDALVADRNAVELKGRHVAVDHAVLARLDPGALACHTTEELMQAASLFRGPFLADLALPRCPGFEAWRIAMADRTELLRIAILRLLDERLADRRHRALVHAPALQA